MKKRVLYHSFSKHFWNSCNICFWNSFERRFYTVGPSDFERLFIQWGLSTSSKVWFTRVPLKYWYDGPNTLFRKIENRPSARKISKKSKKYIYFPKFHWLSFSCSQTPNIVFLRQNFYQVGKTWVSATKDCISWNIYLTCICVCKEPNLERVETFICMLLFLSMRYSCV